jgi:hypothetical protein
MKIARAGDWLTAKVGEELVMMSAEKGNYIGLSEVGARVWELLETESDLDGVCAALQREFDVPPEVCRPEVEAFVKEMAGQGIVTVDAG